MRDRGVSELSRRALARELGTSVATVRRLLAPDASLTALAADEVSRRRRFGRWGMPAGAPEDVALRLLRRALPDVEHRIPEELVWWRLVIDRPTDLPIAEIERRHDEAGENGGSLREQVRLRALLDGLNLGVCLGRLTPDDAVAVLAHHLAMVRVAA